MLHNHTTINYTVNAYPVNNFVLSEEYSAAILIN